MLSPPRARLVIEVVHDLICPWCMLGMHRLLRALRRRPDLACELVWRPFLLNPDMPRSGMPRAEYLLRKFGSEERAQRLYAALTELGRAEGVPFRFELIRRFPNSIDAHRLMRWAARFGRATELAWALFQAHFAAGMDLGNPAHLADIAGSLGLDRAEALRVLLSDLWLDVVHAENLRAHRLGINGVPCFIVAERHAIAGAQEPEVLERLLDSAAMEAAESAFAPRA
jgi:predicted DsbA family dithiol-disulfide isomerase